MRKFTQVLKATLLFASIAFMGSKQLNAQTAKAKTPTVDVDGTPVSKTNVSKKTVAMPFIKKGDAVSYKLLQNETKDWGYAIYLNEKLIIKQTTMPAVIGAKGFASKNAAEAAAKLVVNKLKTGSSSPSLSISEVENINNNPLNN